MLQGYDDPVQPVFGVLQFAQSEKNTHDLLLLLFVYEPTSKPESWYAAPHSRLHTLVCVAFLVKITAAVVAARFVEWCDVNISRNQVAKTFKRHIIFRFTRPACTVRAAVPFTAVTGLDTFLPTVAGTSVLGEVSFFAG